MPANKTATPVATAAGLRDFITLPLLILSIGINPSLHAVRAGYPFAFARNRFWPALNGSRLIAAPLVPGIAAMWELGQEYGIGFTDVVKRATPGMRGLKAADYTAAAPHLLDKIRRHRPAILWFHGKIAAREFLSRVGYAAPAVQWGEQAFELEQARVFVSPNPSPANASYALVDLIGSYNQLAALRARVMASGN